MALAFKTGRSVVRPNRPTTGAHPVRVAVCRATPREGDLNGAKYVGASIAAFFTGASLLLDTGMAHAGGRGQVAEFAASGLLFKDTVEVTALEDPEIQGVTIYFSDFKRNIVDKLAKDFFSDPSQASLTCVVTGPVTIKDVKRISSGEGEEVFSEQKGLNIFKNKTLRVRRVYDVERRTVIYVAYSTRLSTATDEGGVSTGRYRTSMCAVALPPPAAAPPLVPVASPSTDASAAIANPVAAALPDSP
ncbi:hypothetical protein VOLCADRAFT_106628 [Volvox carteri f. nagariensis]|uniref:Uncharacterized protein n=1 Tax=Volvox carteri f. nagariensis TaxID=3068 RepID=D8U8Q0_VOLCA|nr:uncharacterized protein VOLCADRAFT_106628 [Volvox carteri f. nagariensis]EFJ43787.1 hypothetical protein VOLCADRAFT_106628 [Volvox carteri f. nagariensis]|eukprot:XP_002955033.1 hypothetical protein VOLCADRAFT_106628 [Volvox carteri f. nagariensis]